MSYFSTLSSKGQLTVPQIVRRRLGLKEGDRVEFIVEPDRTVIRRAREGDDPFAEFAGALGGFPGGVEEINAWVRDMRDED